MKSIALFNRVSSLSLYLLIFLLPLWFLPFSQDVLGYQKQFLLLILVFLGFVSFIAKALNLGKITFRKSPLHITVLLFLLVVGVSSIFSRSPSGSFWGWPLDPSDNFITFAALGLLYFFVVNSIEKSTGLFSLAVVGISSVALSGLLTLLQLYGVYLIPFDFAKSAGFNTIGTINTIALLSSALLPLALILGFAAKIGLRWLLFGEAFVLFLVSVLINFKSAWIALIVGLLVLLGFGMWNMKKRTEFGWISFPMALLVVGLFFLMFRVAMPGVPTIPSEVSPSQSGEFGIVKQVLKDRLFFGSGPGTFAFEYAEHRVKELNQTIFWGTRFASGASEVLDTLVTKGLLGFVALLAMAGVALFFGFKTLLRTTSDTVGWLMSLGFFASFAALFASAFLYPWQIVTWFLFFLLLSALALQTSKETSLSIAPPSFLAVVSSFVFLLTLIFGLGVLFIGGQKYTAEVLYLQGARASLSGDVDKAIAKLARATQLNSSADLYWRDLGQLYLARANRLSADTALAQEERTKQVQNAVVNAVSSVQNATRTSPANVANWNVQGFVARNLVGVRGAEELAIASYEKATKLEPTSPFNVTELARVYILKAQTLESSKEEGAKTQKEEALAKAQEYLDKAIELKNDYAQAHFLISVIYDEQGKTEEAIQKLEETKNAEPNNAGLAFQLGVVYWQKKLDERAQGEFERALQLNEDYANARYMLGLVYDRRKEREKAIEAFERLTKTNADNEEIQKILENLRAGKPALEGIAQGVGQQQPPLESTPPEIQKSEK